MFSLRSRAVNSGARTSQEQRRGHGDIAATCARFPSAKARAARGARRVTRMNAIRWIDAGVAFHRQVFEFVGIGFGGAPARAGR
jgi:hypothetical protein